LDILAEFNIIVTNLYLLFKELDVKYVAKNYRYNNNLEDIGKYKK